MGWGGGGRGGLFIAGRVEGGEREEEEETGGVRVPRGRRATATCGVPPGLARRGMAVLPLAWVALCLPRTDGTVGRTVHGWTRRTFGRARRTCRVKIALVGALEAVFCLESKENASAEARAAEVGCL